MKYIRFANLVATPFMVGIVWFVQVVPYPLFAKVRLGGSRALSKAH